MRLGGSSHLNLRSQHPHIVVDSIQVVVGQLEALLRELNLLLELRDEVVFVFSFHAPQVDMSLNLRVVFFTLLYLGLLLGNL